MLTKDGPGQAEPNRRTFNSIIFRPLQHPSFDRGASDRDTIRT